MIITLIILKAIAILDLLLVCSFLNNKLSEDRVREIVFDVVDIEKDFFFVSLPCDQVEVNAKLMIQYIYKKLIGSW